MKIIVKKPNEKAKVISTDITYEIGRAHVWTPVT